MQVYHDICMIGDVHVEYSLSAAHFCSRIAGLCRTSERHDLCDNLEWQPRQESDQLDLQVDVP